MVVNWFYGIPAGLFGLLRLVGPQILRGLVACKR